ncbi:MAG: alpha-2-macroglobulin family protein [Azoarcus sp.]|nr:alpha-2-macroglobulin family protein [Azoarcus sp.]
MTTVCRSSLAALAACTLLALSPAARAQQDVGESSGYAPPASEPFFVLADTQYGTADEALLRVEIPASGGKGAVAQYGGIDIALYRVPEPLAFLKAQKNLHRIDVAARPRDEGVANTLAYLWSNAWNKSRRAWRDLFVQNAKQSVTEAAPALKTALKQPDYQPAANFRPLEGFEFIDRFRYPLMAARPIEPLEGKTSVALAGSSSNFIPKNENNFHVPLGKLRPGLYIVEATLGTHRAATLVFVSDTVAVTKLVSGELTVWTAHRFDGRPVLGADLQWTDGRGVLVSATTNADGLATLAHASPERTYLLGQDPAGGVFVSENFYYDSEIHDTKFYTVTDRPLYRPGDEVKIKFLAREYHAANQSSPARAGELGIGIIDPNGAPVWTNTAQFAAERGGDTVFRLPDDAPAGGYEIRVAHQGKTYGAAFRVAEYVKPHLEITIIPKQENFKTGESVSGTIRLNYPNGDPVKNAAIELTLRAQTLTMVQGELRYGGQFPVQLAAASLNTNERGEAPFSLPAAKEPSRLILSALATDGAAYRVRKTSELLIERAAASWKLTGERKFSMPGEAVTFRLEPESPDSESAAPPAYWEIVRLEDQSKEGGKFDTGARKWSPKLDRPGSYSLLLRDAKGNLVAASAHWVGGVDGNAQGVEAVPGTIEMVVDKERYRPGDTAEVLITFSEAVDEALLTLERDRVEASALLSAALGGNVGWMGVERLGPKQWRARIPITEAHAPNMTFSLVYVHKGEYVFQNAGLVVAAPRLTLDIKTVKQSVRPGETVTVDIDASLKGKPARAVLTVSVVDEMIYALQPEIAPDIAEFFQHVRRNNVRTDASLNFITYDEAADYARDAARQPPARHQYNERGIKVLERARRDDTDTAAWQPALLTDEKGHARFSFKMPDALSRWRITVRAVALDDAQQNGAYGQRTAYVQSDKPLYAKWTSPAWMREGDAPVASLAVFNNTDATREAEIVLKLARKEIVQKASLPRGLTYLPFKLPPFSGTQTARLEVREASALADALETPLVAQSSHWRGIHEKALEIERGTVSLDLPAGARRLSLRLAANGSEHFLRIADSLIEYPWGCVEQTSSRLIPLAIVTPLLASDRTQGKTAPLWQALSSQRQRLATLAGPKAVFGWWGHGSEGDAFMTAYAYYADWHAAHALGISLPAEHWEHILTVYRDHASRAPALHRALALWFIQQIGLPVRTQAEGLLASLKSMEKAAPEGSKDERQTDGEAADSPILGQPDSPLGLAYARALASLIASEAGIKEAGAKAETKSAAPAAASRPKSGGRAKQRAHRASQQARDEAPSPAANAHADARKTLQASGLPSARALLLLTGGLSLTEAPAILADATEATPTIDRALTLVWTRKALGGNFRDDNGGLKPAGNRWIETETRFGQTGWRWPADASLPDTLRVGNAPARLTAILRYESEERGESALPVDIARKLYRLERREFKKGVASYAAVPVKPGEKLSAQALYLDEIRLSSKTAYRYGLVEAPLPPGAAIERSTWGIELIEDNGKEKKPLDSSHAEEHPDRYGIPVENLPADTELILRNLLRVGQSGSFTLPPARYHRMYEPARKAYAEGGNATWIVD